MPGIGDRLREARMRQHLDIADVEARTKIRAKYLRALENDEFALLPGPTFVKTFLRTYSEALGLDPHPLVEEYRRQHEPRDEAEHVQPLAPPAASWRDRRAPRPGIIAAVLVVGLLAFLIVLGVTGENDQGGSNSAQTSTGKAKQKKRAKHRQRRKQAPAAVALRLQPAVPTYVCVDKGPGTQILFQGNLSAAQSWKAKKLRVNLGKTSVRLTVNGKAFPIPQGANPVGYEFSATGSKPLPPGQRPCQP